MAIGARGRIDLLRGGQQFGCRIVGHAFLVYDVGKNSSRYCKPPLAFINSINLSAISSLLPSNISAPLPMAGRSSPRASLWRQLPRRCRRSIPRFGSAERRNLQRGDLPDASHADIARLVDAGLNREHAREVDLIHLLVAAFDLAADLELLAVEHFDRVHQRSEWIVRASPPAFRLPAHRHPRPALRSG